MLRKHEDFERTLNDQVRALLSEGGRQIVDNAEGREIVRVAYEAAARRDRPGEDLHARWDGDRVIVGSPMVSITVRIGPGDEIHVDSK